MFGSADNEDGTLKPKAIGNPLARIYWTHFHRDGYPLPECFSLLVWFDLVYGGNNRK